MSSRGQETCVRRRTSERMRIKMLRNLDQFKIANPYRNSQVKTLPDELAKQLRKIQYLSSASISMLYLPFSTQQSPQSEANLSKMIQAQEQQEAKFTSIFGHSMLDLTEVEPQQQSHSEVHPTHPSNGSTILPVRDPMNFHMYQDRSQIHENLFESQAIDNSMLPLMQSSHHNQYHQKEESHRPVNVQDYEQYFNN